MAPVIFKPESDAALIEALPLNVTAPVTVFDPARLANAPAALLPVPFNVIASLARAMPPLTTSEPPLTTVPPTTSPSAAALVTINSPLLTFVMPA